MSNTPCCNAFRTKNYVSLEHGTTEHVCLICKKVGCDYIMIHNIPNRLKERTVCCDSICSDCHSDRKNKLKNN